MKKLIALIVMFVFAFAFVAAQTAEGNPVVSYTFMLTDLGQGVGSGGVLFADGSAGGHGVVSAFNGQIIAHLYPVSWSEVVPGESVDICFDVVQPVGPPIFPPNICTYSSLGVAIPVSGMPILITNPHGGADLLIKVTPTG